MRKLVKVIFRGGFGLGVMYYLNQYLASYGLVAGINVYNGIIIGILGLPGFILLYVLIGLDLWVF